MTVGHQPKERKKWHLSHPTTTVMHKNKIVTLLLTLIFALALLSLALKANGTGLQQVWREYPSPSSSDPTFNVTERYGARSIVLKGTDGKKFLYVFGGTHKPTYIPSNFQAVTVFSFAARRDVSATWKTATKWERLYPIGKDDPKKEPPPRLIDFSIVHYPDPKQQGRGCCLLMGGLNLVYYQEGGPDMYYEMKETFNRTWVFCHTDASSDGEWEEDAAASSTNKPISRMGHAAASSGTEMFIFGGAVRREPFVHMSSDESLKSIEDGVWRFSFLTKQWTQLKLPAATISSRAWISGAIDDSNPQNRTFYIFGGATDPKFEQTDNSALKELWAIYLPVENANVDPTSTLSAGLISTTSQSTHSGVSGRMRATMLFKSGRLVIIGGQPQPFNQYDTNSGGLDNQLLMLSRIRVFNPQLGGSDGWTALYPVAADDPAPDLFLSDSSIAFDDGLLYMTGGWFPYSNPLPDGKTGDYFVYQVSRVLWQLYLCPIGSALPSSGNSALCTNCSAGYYQPLTDLWGTCTACDSNKYSEDTGQTSCNACQPGSVTRSVATSSKYECLCQIGSYLNVSGSSIDCLSCPTGATCPDLGTMYPIAKPGYWIDKANPYTPMPCPSALGCAGGSALNFTCSTGYKGFFCSSCQPNYYKLYNQCVLCPTGVLSVFGKILVIIGIIVLAIVLFFVAHRSGGASHLRKATSDSVKAKMDLDWSSIGIVVSFIQVTAIFAMFEISWPNPLSSFIEALTAFNFNMELMSPECALELNYFDKFALTLCIPLIFGGVLVMVAGLHSMISVWLKNRRREREQKTFSAMRESVVVSGVEAEKMEVQEGVKPSTVEESESEPDQRGEGEGGGGGEGDVELHTIAVENPTVAVDEEREKEKEEETEKDEPKQAKDEEPELEQESAKSVFIKNITLGFLLFIHLAYVAVVSKTFDFFNCRTLDGKRYLTSELNIQCDTGAWSANLGLGVASVVIYVFGLPVVFLVLALIVRRHNAIVEKQREKEKEKESEGEGDKWKKYEKRHVLSSIFDRYRPGFEYYEFFVMLRKMIIAASVVLFTSTIYQIIAASVALLISLLLQTFARPYRARGNNMLEFLGIGTNYLTLFSGLLFSSPEFPNAASRDAVSTVVVVIITGAIVVGVASIVYKVWLKVKAAVPTGIKGKGKEE